MSVDVWKFAQDNVLLITLALVSGGMLLWPYVRGSGGGGASVSTLEATLMMNQQDATVIDLRDAEEYGKGHIVNSRNIPLAQLEGRLKELEKKKGKPVIVCCERGNRSGGAVDLLRKNGFEKAVSLSRGLDAWRQAGLPLEKA
jgi:rhodanese-related sulfurtransferase